MGFDGKTLIHPDQLAIANEVFAPSRRTTWRSPRRQVAAFEAAEARGEGVAVVDGRIVENLHVVDRAAAAGAGRGDRARWRPRHDAARSRPHPLDRWRTSSSGWRRTRAPRSTPGSAPAPARGVIAALLIGLGARPHRHRLPPGAVRAGLRPAVLGDPPQQPADAGRGRPPRRSATRRAAARGWLRHPMLTGVVVWAVAHLLVNGDAASLVLFGWPWALWARRPSMRC